MGSADSFGKAVFLFRDSDQVDVINHQAVGPEVDSELLTAALQVVQINEPVFLPEEDRLSAVATLDNVMWEAWNNYSGKSGHEKSDPFDLGLPRG